LAPMLNRKSLQRSRSSVRLTPPQQGTQTSKIYRRLINYKQHHKSNEVKQTAPADTGGVFSNNHGDRCNLMQHPP